MNKGYTYIDGKVIISDEFGNHTKSEYYDNLDKVLVEENIIEEMKNRIQELTKESEKYKVKRFIPFTLYTIIGSLLIGIPLLLWAISGTNPYLLYFDTIFGSKNMVFIFTSVFSIVFLPIGAITTCFEYSSYKEDIKKGKGINSELEFLKSQIEKEKEKLNSLQKEKTRVNENTEFRSLQVDDKQQLKALRNCLELYYDLGYNAEKYYRYYQQERLEKKLEKYYDEPEIELAKKYIEEKGPTLVRKKRNSR